MLSASIKNALLAKTELDRSEIYVVASLTLSSAIGLLTDTLDYLYMVWRCSSMPHLIGSVLKIRPIIEVNKNGTLGVKTKVGGSRKKALRRGLHHLCRCNHCQSLRSKHDWDS